MTLRMIDKTTNRLVCELSKMLHKTRDEIIEVAIYDMAVTYQIAGVGVEWSAEAERRGYRKGNKTP